MGLQARPTWYCTFCNTKQWFRRQKQNVKEQIPYFYQLILLNSIYDTEPLHLIQSSTGFINKTMCEGNHPLSLVRVLWLLTKSTPKFSISIMIIKCINVPKLMSLCAFFWTISPMSRLRWPLNLKSLKCIRFINCIKIASMYQI